jgi:sugar lactone lactonase YvrE
LTRHDIRDRTTVWSRHTGIEYTSLSSPPVTVSPEGYIYFTDRDKNTIRVHDPDGHHTHTLLDLTSHGIVEPMSLCIDSTGRYLCVGEEYTVSLVSNDGTQARFLVTTPDNIISLCLYKDKFLAIGTSKGLLVYDISAGT